MLNINNLLKELKERTEAKAYHPYLLKFLDRPIVDEDKVLLLWSIFNELEIQIDIEERNAYIFSTMLVQIALDTHEKVTNTVETADSGSLLKNRQLTVLAGDYYSGLYYQLLADTKNISLIKVLSNATKEMNEHKILLYQKSMTEVSDLLSSLKIIESSLVCKIADYFNLPLWGELSGSMLLLNRLYAEKKAYLTNRQSIVFEALDKMLFPPHVTRPVLFEEQEEILLIKMDQCIIHAHRNLEQFLDRLSPDSGITIKERISAILESTDIAINTFVEEG